MAHALAACFCSFLQFRGAHGADSAGGTGGIKLLPVLPEEVQPLAGAECLGAEAVLVEPLVPHRLYLVARRHHAAQRERPEQGQPRCGGGQQAGA